MGLFDIFRSTPRLPGLGWRPDLRDDRDIRWKPGNQLGADVPDTVSNWTSLEPFVWEVFDQGPSSSCVAQGITAAVSLREAVLGRTYRPISRRALYTMSRASHGATRDDSGTYPRSAWRALRRHGCPLEADWGWSAKRINEIPPSTLLLRGYERAELRYEYIPPYSLETVPLVREAIAAGLPVAFGTQVDRKFQLHRGAGVYEPSGEASVGGHLMVIVGYRSSDGALRILNSWSRHWGDGGFAWVSQDWARRNFRDLAVCYGWRRIQV